MATARAARKSRPRASRSDTTTASSAKDAKNEAADWSERDQEAAVAEGWGVFTCIDEKTHKVFLEMQAEGDRFDTDNKAREYIAFKSKAGDALALRAIRAVFRSKAGATPKKGK